MDLDGVSYEDGEAALQKLRDEGVCSGREREIGPAHRLPFSRDPRRLVPTQG